MAKTRYMSPSRVSSPLLLIARIWTAISLLFLIIMLAGSLFDGGLPDFGEGSREVLAFLFFPLMVFVGLILTWKWRIAGSLITLAGMLVFFFLIGEMEKRWIFYLIAAPGVLFPIEKVVQADKSKS